MHKLIEELINLHSIPLKSTGTSMLPILKENDIVYYKKITFQKIKVNDILTFRHDGQIISHRVIYKTNNYLIAKGDTNTTSDGRIYPKHIIGKVYQIKRDNQIISPESAYLLQSTIYFKEIIKIKTALERAKINFVILKGLPLHLYFEKTHPQRLYADCDILVEKTKQKILEKILAGLGFKPENQVNLSTYKKFLKVDLKEKSYYKIINNFFVSFDIHNEISFTHSVQTPILSLENQSVRMTQSFLSDKRFVNLTGNSIPILSYNHLVLYLLHHLYNHLWTSIRQLDFIALAIKKSENKINWPEIIEIAHNHKVLNFIIPGIFLLKKYFKVREPYQIVKNKYKSSLGYSMQIYRIFCHEESLFGEADSENKSRLKRAVLIFLLYDDRPVNKIVQAFRPNLVLHLTYFVFGLLVKKIFKIKLKNGA